MGKKGKKKKEKLTGTPDVVKFKQTREFFLLKECVNCQESLPFVAIDRLDTYSFQKVSRFLNMVGLLAEFLQVDSNKDYRFNEHHEFLAPQPQYFPFGYDADVIRSAREVQDNPVAKFNGKDYPYPEELRTSSEEFLKAVDRYMTRIASEIEPKFKDDFGAGLKKFKADLKETLSVFDEIWMKYEHEYMKAKHKILDEVFMPIAKLVTTESALTQAEERLDIRAKQALENEFIMHAQDFIHTLFPETRAEEMPADTIPLAEACVFYETKCTEEWLHLAKHLIKDYLELRIFVMNIPKDRIHPEHQENTQMCRLLRNFHTSVMEAREALAFVAKLPRLFDSKTSDWMTRKLLEPDLKHIQKVQALGADK